MTEARSKTPEAVDAIMAGMPEKYRSRWCGGENGPCACMGCVYTESKAAVASVILGYKYRGDAEHLSERLLMERNPEAYASHMLTREEWEAWRTRMARTTEKGSTNEPR